MMKLVHSNIQKGKKSVKSVEAIQRERSLKWIASQNRRIHEKLIKEMAAEIKGIQAVEPGWLPKIKL